MADGLDRQFVSYPKSGRSWLRYALHVLGVEPQIRFHHDGCEFSNPSKPPLALDFSVRRQRCRSADRVVYMDRDPRDCITSLYFQIKGRMADVYRFDGGISEFIRDEYFGIANLLAFQRQWLDLCASGLALHVSYEACHADFPKVLRDVLIWYAFEIPEDRIAEACDEAGFTKMLAIERAGTFAEPWLRPRNGARKTRRGIVGAHAEVLPASDVSFIENCRVRNGLGHVDG